MKSFRYAQDGRNPVLAQEEEAILLSVERALASSTNSQTIGRNGELPFLSFLQRYLPNTLRATSGHFLTPAGNISPQADVIVFDARYPLLAENTDGSTLVMLHSVVRIFEIKTNLTTRDLSKSLASARLFRQLVSQLPDFADEDSFAAPAFVLLAYKCFHRLNSLEKIFFSEANTNGARMDAVLLRYHQSDQDSFDALGGQLHLEPPFPEEGGQGSLPGGFFPMSHTSSSPLSDLYYSLVQDSYYTLGERDYSLSEIGAHFNDYMS